MQEVTNHILLTLGKIFVHSHYLMKPQYYIKFKIGDVFLNK